MTEFRSDADLTVANVFVVPINGGVDNPNLNFTGERGNLDTQFNVGRLLHRWRYTGDLGAGPSARQWLLYMVDLPNVPQTVSVPHFTKEVDISSEYAFRLCGLFAALGARGVSVLVASGDDGVGRGNDPFLHPLSRILYV